MWWKVLNHTHTYSGKADHGGVEQPPASYQKLSQWAQRCGIDAIGMGSPYTPRTAANYMRFDGAERDQYYSPDFDKNALLAGDDISIMLRDANAVSQQRPLFYLDNETPKARYGHLWWVGYRRDLPEWHDYDQPFDRWMVHESIAGDGCDEPMPYERRPYLQILGTQRSHRAMGFWAHPTSWWTGERNQFITNIATEMPAHAIADGRLDGMVVVGYHPYRPQYLDLWYELLDRGYRVPGVAEMDCGLSDAKLWQDSAPLLNYIYHADDQPITETAMREAFRSGRIVAGNGPLIDMTVDRHATGEVAATGNGVLHEVRIDIKPAPGMEKSARVELLTTGGKVIWHRDDVGAESIKLSIPGTAHRSYLIARVFGDRAGGHFRDIGCFATGNPVYLHPPGTDFQQPATTDVCLDISERSVCIGAEIRFETMAGELLLATTGRAGRLRETLPASGRVSVVGLDGTCQTRYLLNSNKWLTDVQRYLYRGRFLKDFPSLTPGEVPVQAWRLDDFVEAMREVRLEL
jgi:hypothetical protein